MSTHGAAETSARAAAEAYVAGVAKGPDAAHAEVVAFGVADGEIIQSSSMGQAGLAQRAFWCCRVASGCRAGAGRTGPRHSDR